MSSLDDLGGQFQGQEPSLRVEHCRITENASVQAGGIAVLFGRLSADDPEKAPKAIVKLTENVIDTNTSSGAIAGTAFAAGGLYSRYGNRGTWRMSGNALDRNDPTGVVIEDEVTKRPSLDLQNNEMDRNVRTGLLASQASPTVAGGTVSGNGEIGIRLVKSQSKLSRITLVHNVSIQIAVQSGSVASIDDCRLDGTTATAVGVVVAPDAMATIRECNIEHHVAFGINRVTATGSEAAVDAKNNWWGAASGPTIASNPGGTGDRVSDKVLYAPFRATPRP